MSSASPPRLSLLALAAAALGPTACALEGAAELAELEDKVVTVDVDAETRFLEVTVDYSPPGAKTGRSCRTLDARATVNGVGLSRFAPGGTLDGPDGQPRCELPRYHGTPTGAREAGDAGVIEIADGSETVRLEVPALFAAPALRRAGDAPWVAGSWAAFELAPASHAPVAAPRFALEDDTGTRIAVLDEVRLRGGVVELQRPTGALPARARLVMTTPAEVQVARCANAARCVVRAFSRRAAVDVALP